MCTLRAHAAIEQVVSSYKLFVFKHKSEDIITEKPYDASSPTHYGHARLSDALLNALAGAGKDIDDLTPGDLAPFDNRHVRGRAATRGLAQLAGLRPGTRVLDVGS